MCLRLQACGLLLLLGAGVFARAESSVPLESTKQELRQLERDQKSSVGPGGASVPTVDTPSIQFQTPGADTPQQWLNEKLKRERRQLDEKPPKNWLVDGVQKLGIEEQRARSGLPELTKAARAESQAVVVDTSDPHYLLKLFDEQKGSRAKDGKAATGKSPAAAPDAFAPFLQDWLGSSPVRGQFFDQFVRPADTAAGSSVAPGVRDFRPTSSGFEVAPVREPAQKANPYLAELESPALKQLPDGASSASLAPLSARNPDLVRPATTATPPEPFPEAKPAAKGPPAGWADDKKYFPQLKKF